MNGFRKRAISERSLFKTLASMLYWCQTDGQIKLYHLKQNVCYPSVNFFRGNMTLCCRIIHFP